MSVAEPELPDTQRSTLRRKRERGTYHRETIDSILDEGLICHIGFTEGGSTFVVPTAYARVGDSIYVHGALANRMLRVLASGVEACLTVTLLDGLVFSRSAFHHSMNYRSVMLFASAERIDDASDKREALLAILDHMAMGRSRDARAPTPSELRSTTVLRFPIVEGSAKVRTGGPIEEDEDRGLPVWAGVVPLVLESGTPVPDEHTATDMPVPTYVKSYPKRRSPA